MENKEIAKKQIFSSRHFNKVVCENDMVIKTSRDKKKMKGEYNFYHLLPDSLKAYCVETFDYQENDMEAMYSMPVIPGMDLGKRWVAGEIDTIEFAEILDKYFEFFSHRPIRQISDEEYQSISDLLYVTKVEKRMEQLFNMPEFKQLMKYLHADESCRLDKLYAKYINLKTKIEKQYKLPLVKVVGHGDPCFSNTLYVRKSHELKLIDPKGAVTEPELWMNPYYDLAKLSHSICGNYDFLNQGKFKVEINNGLSLSLHTPVPCKAYVDIFKAKLKEYGYRYELLRVYEASLFLSMLPLHMDVPKRVLGFIINARDILLELEKY